MEPDAPRSLADQPDVQPGADEEEFVEDIPDDEEEEGQQQPDEAPAGEQAEPSDQEPGSAPPTGQPRDERGRFAGAEEGAAKPGAEKAPPAAAAQAPPTPEAEGPPAWSFNADGEAWRVEGSRLTDEGLFLPKPSLELITGLLAEGVHHRRSWPAERAKLEREFESRLNQAEARAASGEKLFQSIEALMDKGPEAVAEWLDKLTENWPAMLAEAKKAGEDKERELREARLKEYEEREAAEELVPHLESALDATVEELARQYPDVDFETIRRRLYDSDLGALFFQADRDYPEHGLTQGQYAIRRDLVEKEFRYASGLAKRRAGVEKVQAQHARALGTTKVPPTVSPGGAVAPGGEEKMPEFANTPEGKKKFDEWWRKKYGGQISPVV